ncbi:ATP-binding Cassette (ABC) Superfamily [Phytophthora nicotianae]|uniref:ATP-binding Cassette (ABC) Superfamily n=1 Tax=Phytophthora nicotianae TaxID=4792 RepID=A0A0W8DNI8_PHYNI|nr:ATP-binding Cassette (ABC) Superfamily [Phytophthora nicotianae]
MEGTSKKPMWGSPLQDDDNQRQEHFNPEPEPPMESENDRLGVHTLLMLRTPPMMPSPHEKEAARHFEMHNSVISLLSSSPDTSSDSDTTSNGTDRSNGPHYMARNQSSSDVPMLNRMSSQLENEAAGTLLVYQPTCLDHHNDSHQESRQRLCVLGGPEGVLHKDRFKDLKWANLNELRPARLNDILRVHTIEYIQHLERACGNLPEQNKKYLVGTLYDKHKGDKELTYAEWLQTEHALKCFEVGDQPSAGSFDMDSPISKSSYMAARMAAGAVCHAIDKVLNNETKNAFVVVRPPGHHAGPNGCVEGEGFHLRPEMCTCGFCLINNVCIGASYAMSNYSSPFYTPAISSMNSDSLLSSTKRANIQRVAIVDFDIHHGNGTEEVIRNLIPHKQNYPLPPSWAPVQFSSYKPWRDENDPDNVFFSSIHLYDDDNFYPCSGMGPHGCSPELEKSKNIVNLPLKVLGPKYLDERLKLTSKAKRSLMEQSSKTFRNNVTKKLIPALTKFQPDLIMLSAGFDGHADDFYYFLSEDDYGWITDQITAVADECCDGRIVSVLEGGYNVVPSKFQRPQPKSRKNATSNFHHAAKMHNRPVDEELDSRNEAAMSERKAVIKNADMHEDMQQDAVDCASQALEKYNIEKDIAAFIKKEFDKKYNPTWHCIVGRNFGSYVTHETKHFIYFYLGQVAILLFKSG